ncbi:altered inheritance of mitochondria protein 24, mitochondrial [Scheffersomyces amazonensis]|uniref:altered inheritance of mitochondria protein 24, mitochondrial n=1 Tax=Scheffersomyces amazonensis TaxID=1078765 RepID=UPI00315CBC2F
MMIQLGTHRIIGIQVFSKRCISILQPPSTVSGSKLSNTTTDNSNIKDVEQLQSIKTLETAEFKALGSPQSILSINSPPSVPVFVRRGSLLSIYGFNSSSSISTVTSNLEIIDPIKRLFYGGYVSSYQKLISTTPFSLLVSSISRNFTLFKKSENKTFASLLLDGSNDWAILSKDALQVYTGNSLNIGMYVLPSIISKRLSKILKTTRTSTGLCKFSRSGYTLLTGRGQVGLVGNGTIYNINLQEDEELLINQQNLLGITVNGPYDLQNCIIKYSFPTNDISTVGKTQVIKKKELSFVGTLKSNATGASKLRLLGSLFGNYFKTISSYFSYSKKSIYNTLVGNQNFVKVIGPRNILVQSNTSESAFLSQSKSSLPPPSVDGTTFHKIKRTSSDYLSYVTIKPDRSTSFKSTPDFKESVEQLQKKK